MFLSLHVCAYAKLACYTSRGCHNALSTVTPLHVSVVPVYDTHHIIVIIIIVINYYELPLHTQMESNAPTLLRKHDGHVLDTCLILPLGVGPSRCTVTPREHHDNDIFMTVSYRVVFYRIIEGCVHVSIVRLRIVDQYTSRTTFGG